MNLLIHKENPANQKCNVLYFILDDQWFNLTALDMKAVLINAALEYHEPQTIPVTSLPNSTSPPSPASMRPLFIWYFPHVIQPVPPPL